MAVSTLLAAFVQWIETHGTTVDLLKWMVVGLLAWALGLFRYLRAKLKRPKLEVESLTSRCIWKELGVVDGNDHTAQVVFLIEAGINNPTTEPVVVRDFTLQVKRHQAMASKEPLSECRDFAMPGASLYWRGHKIPEELVLKL